MRKVVHIFRNENNKEFYYVNLGALDHYRPIHRLWIPKKLVRKCEKTGELYLQFPIKGVRIEKGKKDLILKPGRYNLFYYFVWSGHRGETEMKVKDWGKTVITHQFQKYESPRGSLGISKEVLILTPFNSVEIEWSRTGFVEGRAKKGVTRIYFEDDYNNRELKIIENPIVETIEDIDLEGIERLASLLEISPNENTICKIYE
ncbi:MAG: hypothetical protein JHC31_12630 [Sulfurihydrogenibium sp.]|jgi:hypothetical protein|nr:hypothetical protein [Sulfurihydrogenibium sp.]